MRQLLSMGERATGCGGRVVDSKSSEWGGGQSKELTDFLSSGNHSFSCYLRCAASNIGGNVLIELLKQLPRLLKPLLIA